MKSKLHTAFVQLPCTIVAFTCIPNLALAGPATFLEGFYLDSGSTSYVIPFQSGSGSTFRNNVDFSAQNGGLLLYSAQDETVKGNLDGGITLYASPISMVLGSSTNANPDTSSFNIWRSSAWGGASTIPLFSVDGLSGNTTFSGSNVAINSGALNVSGVITSSGSPVLTSVSALSNGFVQASSSGVINLTGSTPGITANGSSIFALDASGKVDFASNRPTSISSITPATNSKTGAFTVAGGIGVSLDSWFNGVRIGKGNGSVSSNTAIGDNALSANLTASSNTAIGKSALAMNTSGSSNTAIGTDALGANTTGAANVAVGPRALKSNLTSAGNIAVGTNALQANTTGGHNITMGLSAGYYNTTGSYNMALGTTALYANTTGSSNIAIGYQAGRYHADGATSLSDPDKSIYLGSFSRGKDNLDDNSIVIGYQAIGLGANTTVIGNSTTTSARIYGDLVAGTGAGSPVLTQATASSFCLAVNPSGIRGNGATLNNGGLIAMGNGAQSIGTDSVAIGNSAIASASSVALGNYSRCSESAFESAALVGGSVTKGNSFAVAYGEANGELSFAFGGGVTTGDSSIALGGYDYQQGNWPGNQSTGSSSATIGGVGNVAAGFSSLATGFWTKASCYGMVAIGSLNLGSGSTVNGWVETDSLFELGNGNSVRAYSEPPISTRSNAITTLKNGQTTLTNKAWKADSNVVPVPENSNGQALVVEGHSVLKGKTTLEGQVIISVPQGDISMGIYGN